MKGSFYERGSSMVETAIVLGVFLIMVFGIIDLSRAAYTYHLVSNAARLGARFAMVRGATCSHFTSGGADPYPCPINPPDTSGEIQQYVQQQSIMLGIGNVTVTPSWTGQDSNGNPYPGCKGGSPYNFPGCPVSVTVTYTFTFLAPFVSTVSIPMSSTSQMVISQ